jgi:hypothetical protein
MANRQTPEAEASPKASASIFETLVDAAVEAAVNAFLIVVLGSVALGMVGGIFQKMVPSAPPGLGDAVRFGGSDTWNLAYATAKANRFALVFAVIWPLTTWSRLANRRSAGAANAARWQGISRRVSENWFGLVVVNAFVAMITATVLATVPTSAWWWLWKPIQQFLGPPFHSAMEFVLGPAGHDRLQGFASWYGENQVRFNFWFLYLSSVCDDLGIPNWKTLLRRLWRRWRKQPGPPQPAESVEPS